MTKPQYSPMGVSGLRRQSGYVYEEFLSQLRYPRAAKIYQEMSSNDPVIGAILFLAEMIIMNAGWTVKSAGESAKELADAEFLRSCMDDMDVSWADTITEVLSMLTYGFSFHEIIYKIRRGPDETNGKYRSKHTDNKIGWKRMPIRSQSTLHSWEFDESDGDIKAFVQQAPPAYAISAIPISKGLLFRTKLNRDNPEGRSMLRNAYRPWYFKKRIEEIEGIGIERDLAGLPVLTAPEGLDLWSADDDRMKALKTDAEALVSSIKRDSEEGVLLPFGWELKLLATGSARQFDTNAIINRYDNRIAITMLSDIVLIGGDNAGSFALADAKQSLLSAALEATVKNIADTFNTYAVTKLFKVNGMFTDKLPQIVPGEIEAPAIKEIALLLRAMGLDISKDFELQNYLRKIASLPEMDKETFAEVYEKQTEKALAAKTPVDPKGEKKPKDNPDDTAQKAMEQNDQNYTGQGE